MNFKNWLINESDTKSLQDAVRSVNVLGMGLGYLANNLQNAPNTVPDEIRKNSGLVSAAIQACSILSQTVANNRTNPGWFENNQQTIEKLLTNIITPLQKLLPLIPPTMGKIAENGKIVLDKITAAGIGTTPQPPTTQQPQNGPQPISISRLEFDYRLPAGTLDIQKLKSGLVAVRNRKTGKVVSVKADLQSIEDGITQIM